MGMRDKIDKAIAKCNLLAVVVARHKYDYVETYGEIEGLLDSGMYRNLFGDKSKIDNLYRSLEGQLLPRIWNQDGIDCFVSRLDDGIIYAMFSNVKYDPASLYEASKAAEKAIAEILIFEMAWNN